MVWSGTGSISILSATRNCIPLSLFFSFSCGMASSPRKQTLKEIVIYGGKTNGIIWELTSSSTTFLYRKLSKDYMKQFRKLCKAGLNDLERDIGIVASQSLHTAGWNNIVSINRFDQYTSFIATYHSLSISFYGVKMFWNQLLALSIARQTSSISRKHRKVRVTRNRRMEGRKYRWNICGRWLMRGRRLRG